MITKEEKTKLIEQFRRTPEDSGSTEVQVSIITTRINNLIQHFDAHKKDFASKRGLAKLVSQRKRLLIYLKGQSQERYQTLIQQLGLRK